MADKDATENKFRAWNPQQQKHVPANDFIKDDIKTPSSDKLTALIKWQQLRARSSVARHESDLDMDKLSLEDRVSQLESKQYEMQIVYDQFFSYCVDRLKELYENIDDKPGIRIAQIFDISEDYELVCPISIVIEEYSEYFVARFPELELSASGETESEAIINLKIDNIELYVDLIGTPKEKLGKLPLSWLRILVNVIKPIGKR